MDPGSRREPEHQQIYEDTKRSKEETESLAQTPAQLLGNEARELPEDKYGKSGHNHPDVA